ncbi:GspH/FimT family pseudopilin [Candidatus Desulforudis audaxviator]|uniref:General secretion pathway protein H n=1 Tax=Desulforudis audaxviator (strain MP104C) TaxID=477974 RepID=B1I3D8_DESAP|nr:GspH/FimT family pseudopilin [Candidatus Desulforudis audaxviator]ACA59483.1 general secretion pathway protein H [Candidatus Desulforudis audaxviator MP104C]AZK59466.1 Type IV fimbrial biogenesis protein FimT [Candidatus Desulforudis audaxviator]
MQPLEGRGGEPGSGKAGSAGFTLIEMAVVLAIIGIILAVAVPNMRTSLDSYHVRSAAAEIATTIRYAQQESVSREMRHKIVFDSGRNSYTLYRIECVDPGDPEEIQTELESSSLPANVLLAGTTFPAGELTFGEQGRPSTAGQVTLKGGSGQSRLVVVDGTGGVRVMTPSGES